ncbi:MAG TPA: hypothetical protein PLB52_03785 [Candidatus Moranbacteria bacterium]|nr:hypothetical protein [Candidatus Moranbacteria bacterium]
MNYTFFGDLEMIGKQRFFRKTANTKQTANNFSEFAKKIIGLDCIGVPMPEEKSSSQQVNGNIVSFLENFFEEVVL